MPEVLQGRVLSIAGSDPSGGAGIQADIKTITALGGYAAAAITCLTVQNTIEVRDVVPVEPEAVGAQVDAVLEDIGADAVKTGMLFSSGIIKAVAGQLQGRTAKLVVDPVMVASSGAQLIDDTAVAAIKTMLIPGADLITPNIPEVKVLTGIDVRGQEDMPAAAEAMMVLGCKAVLLKGGHLEGDRMVDGLFVDGQAPLYITSTKIKTRNTHGTGCTTASAFATLLAQGETLADAFPKVHAFVREAIEKAPNLGAGHGPLGHAKVGR